MSEINPPFACPLAFGISIVCGLVDDVILVNEGDRGDGAPERLPADELEGECSATRDGFPQPKKDVSLFGPGDRGVLVIIVGSVVSSSKKDCSLGLMLTFEGRLLGCKEVVAALCKLPIAILVPPSVTSCDSGSLANRT